MCGGGGGYRPPPDNSAEVERMQQAEREANRVREDARRASEEASRRAAFSTGLNNAEQSFRTRAQSNFNTRGLDWNQFGNVIEQAISGQRARVPDLDPNPQQFFGDDLIESAISREQSARREANTRQVRGMFQPNEELSAFADTADDPFIDAIIGRQRGEAMNTLDMARRRGNLDDRGYTSALDRLNEKERAARAQANEIGSSVLGDYRGRLRGVANEAEQRAGNYMLGEQFDPNAFRTRWDSTRTDLTGRLEGDLNTRLGSEQFFDVGDIITRGGSTQGAVNPRTELLDVLAKRDQTRNTNRGLGSGGGTF